VPDKVKYWPPFSDNTVGENEETMGLGIDRTEKERDESDPVNAQDTACGPGTNAENGNVQTT
jgi:hypothetical protein